MTRRDILMTFSYAPSAEDLVVIARNNLDSLPLELADLCTDLTVTIEEFPDEATEQELELDSPYELLALYKSAREITPGVEKKIANGEDCLILYRRPILDMWCETSDDLNDLVRQIMVGEIASHFDFPEDQIEDITRRAALV